LSSPPQPGLGRVIWDAWRAYTHRAGGYQAQVLLSAVYYLVLGPSVLVARLFGTRLLDLDRDQRASYWIERKPLEGSKSLSALERQF
jgi:hypothetical protein